MSQSDDIRSKAGIDKGLILWLREDAHERDVDAWYRSGVGVTALNHPVLVVDTLRRDHEYLWVCIVSTAQIVFPGM